MKVIDYLEHSGRISRRNFLGITIMGLLAACSPKRQAEVPPADTRLTPTTSPTKDPTPIRGCIMVSHSLYAGTSPQSEGGSNR